MKIEGVSAKVKSGIMIKPPPIPIKVPNVPTPIPTTNNTRISIIKKPYFHIL